LWHAIVGTKPKIEGKASPNHGFRPANFAAVGEDPLFGGHTQTSEVHAGSLKPSSHLVTAISG
jgi:hypothetical protein